MLVFLDILSNVPLLSRVGFPSDADPVLFCCIMISRWRMWMDWGGSAVVFSQTENPECCGPDFPLWAVIRSTVLPLEGGHILYLYT